MQSLNDECPICLEELDAIKNRATTECGHCFHTSCLVKHSVLTNIVCPLCRNDLADIPEEEYDSYDDSDEGEDDEYEESDDATTNPDNSVEAEQVVQRRTVTQILSVMNRQNITNRHLVSALISTTYQQSWMDKYFILNEADDKEDEVMEILENISTLPVDHRDTRRYAEVLLNIPAITEAGAGPSIISRGH
jgi:hypothetical protein